MITQNPPLSPMPPASVEPASPRRRFSVDVRYVAPILITLILLAAQTQVHVLETFPKTLLAIATAISTEIVLSLLIYKKFPHLASAYVSGISVGILVRSPEVWPYVLCGFVSIASKYVLRVKGRHLWNPSNFGIAALLFLAPAAVASLSVQWDNNFYAMLVIWTLGSVIVSRLHRLHICVTYVLSFFAFAWLRSAFSGLPFASEVAPITGPMYQLFIFFMITDPKSTVKPRWGQCLVAFSVALAEHVLRLFQNTHAPYFALFLVGPIANLIEIGWQSRRKTFLTNAVPMSR